MRTKHLFVLIHIRNKGEAVVSVVLSYLFFAVFDRLLRKGWPQALLSSV